MKTFYRVCLKDYEEIDVLGHKLSLKQGERYLTSKEEKGMVTVFTNWWHKVSVEIFHGEEIFTS